jgi:ABC-type phosphate/phosphonate transport system substrate-binding protein
VRFIACTRMYDVTPIVRSHWHRLLGHVARRADVELECIEHAAPKPLTDLWSRDDLAAAFMCGFPFATRYPDVRPLAAPVTVIADDGAPTYRSVWLVRADSAFDSLSSTFGHRIGWLAEHSHSGFNAPRHALLPHRSPDRPALYRQSIGPLEHPRGALQALADGRVDVVALDAWWWWLLGRHDAVTATGLRVIDETPTAPIPLLVCGARCPAQVEEQLIAALLAVHEDHAVAPHLAALGVCRFANIARKDYEVLAELDRTARAVGYPLPG